jgi:SAM-dependent methyltransferase
MNFNSIDWNAMWKSETAGSHWQKASKKELWDKRAHKFNKKVSKFVTGENRDKEDYISKVLARIEIKPGWTVLDIGSGPGSLAIPLAKKAASVTALDISSEMLKYSKINADAAGVNNITFVNSSWEDATANKLVEKHDVVVASRSLTPVDINLTMSALDSIARQAVYITLPIIHLPFDWEAYRAIGRDGKKKRLPYVYVYNALYQMGITANVEILYSRVITRFKSIEEAIENLQWRTDPFTQDEKAKLTEFLEKKFSGQKGKPVFTHEGRSVWALIWWAKKIDL